MTETGVSLADIQFDSTPQQVEVQKPLLVETAKKPITKEVLAKLRPERFKDDEGNEHDLFTFRNKRGNEIRVVFYSREELPFNRAVVKDNQGIILGGEPKYRKKEDWLAFTKKVKDASNPGFQAHMARDQVVSEAIKENRALFFVENSPTSLIDMALWLGAEGTDLREARQKSVNKILTPKALEIIDQAIAGKMIDDDGNIRADKNTDGEALTILALTGDQDARSILNSANERLVDSDHKNFQAQTEATKKEYESLASDHEALQLKDLVAVHVTMYLPQDTDGELSINTTFDGTNWEVPETSVHFALNHPVESHMFGNWDSTTYAVIAPLNKLMDVNGKPASLNTVDTFFEVSPGTKLRLPKETWVVKPGETPSGVLYQKTPDQQLIYRSKNLSPEDIAALLPLMKNDDVEIRNLNYELYKTITKPELYGINGKDFQNAIISEEEREAFIESLGGVLNPNDLYAEFTKEKIPDVLKNIFLKANIRQKIPASLIDKISKETQALFASKVKEAAIRTHLRDLGYKDQPGGMWSWGDQWPVTAQTMGLGAELQIPVRDHNNTSSGKVQEAFVGSLGTGIGFISELSEGEIRPDEYKSLAFEKAREWFTQSSPATRRMLYLIGAI